MATKIFEVYGTVRADTRALAADLAKAKGLMLRFGTGSGAAIKDNLGTIGRTLAAFPARIFQNIFNPSAAGMAAAMTDRIAGTGQAMSGLLQVARGAGGLFKQMFLGTGPSMFAKGLTNIRSVASRVFGPMATTIGNAFAPFKANLGTMASGFSGFAAGLVRGTTGWASMWISTLSGGVRSFANAFNQIGSMARAVVGPIAAIGSALAIGAAVRSFAAFDAEMRNVQVISHATDAEFQSMTEHARELGRTTVFGATSAAQALTELVKGGFSAADSQLVLGDTLNLAAAANMSLANASTLMVRILSSQGLAMSESARVADVLTNAANLSTTDVAALGEAFRQVGPLTKQAGMSIEETSAIFMAFAAAGIDASSAGNNLKRILTRMVQQPRAVAREFQALGITIDNGQGGFRSMADIIDDLNRATANMTDIEKQAAIGKIGGLYAASALMQAMDVGGDAIRRNTQLVSQSGTAAAVAGVRTQGLMGAFRLLAAVAQDLGISLGKALGPMLESITGWLKNVAAEMGPWIEMNGEMIAKVAGITLAIGGLVVVLPMLGRAIMAMFGPVGILLTVLTGLGVAIYNASKEPGFLQSAFKQLGEVMKSVGNVFAGVWKAIVPTLAPIGNAIIGIFSKIGTWIKANEATLVRFGTAIGLVFINVIKIIGNMGTAVGNLIGRFLNLFGLTGDNWLETLTQFSEGVALVTGNIQSAFTVMWRHILATTRSTLAAMLRSVEDFATMPAFRALGLQVNLGSDTQQRLANENRQIAATTFGDMQQRQLADAAATGDPDAMSRQINDLRDRAAELMSRPSEIVRQEVRPRREIGRSRIGEWLGLSSRESPLVPAMTARDEAQRLLAQADAVEQRAMSLRMSSPERLARDAELAVAREQQRLDITRRFNEDIARGEFVQREQMSHAFAAAGGPLGMFGAIQESERQQQRRANDPWGLRFQSEVVAGRQVRENRRAAGFAGIAGQLAGGFGGLGALAGLARGGPGVAAAAGAMPTDAGVKVSGVSDLWRQVQEGMGKTSPEDRRHRESLDVAEEQRDIQREIRTAVQNPPPPRTAP